MFLGNQHKSVSDTELFSMSESRLDSMVIDIVFPNQTDIAMGWDDFPAILSDDTSNTAAMSSSEPDSCNFFGSANEENPQRDLNCLSIDPLDDISRSCANSSSSTAAMASYESNGNNLGSELQSLLIKRSRVFTTTALDAVNQLWSSNSSVPDFVDTSDDDSDQLSELDFPTICDEDFQLFHATNDINLAANGNRRRVRFSTVNVREYQLTLGDHPWAVSYPLSLDWSYSKDSERTYDVDEFYKRQLEYYHTHERDENDELPSHSRTFGRPSHLDVMERRSRLANAIGISFEKLDSMERQRKMSLEESSIQIDRYCPNVDEF
jgi:hypothetical protein